MNLRVLIFCIFILGCKSKITKERRYFNVTKTIESFKNTDTSFGVRFVDSFANSKMNYKFDSLFLLNLNVDTNRTWWLDKIYQFEVFKNFESKQYKSNLLFIVSKVDLDFKKLDSFYYGNGLFEKHNETSFEINYVNENSILIHSYHPGVMERRKYSDTLIQNVKNCLINLQYKGYIPYTPDTAYNLKIENK